MRWGGYEGFGSQRSQGNPSWPPPFSTDSRGTLGRLEHPTTPKAKAYPSYSPPIQVGAIYLGFLETFWLPGARIYIYIYVYIFLDAYIYICWGGHIYLHVAAGIRGAYISEWSYY